MFGASPEDKFKLSLLAIEKKFIEIENEIKDLQQKAQNAPAKGNIPPQSDLNQKISNLNARISKLEQELHGIKSKMHLTAVSDDQIKELLEKIILVETRVTVLEKNITEPRRLQPIILE